MRVPSPLDYLSLYATTDRPLALQVHSQLSLSSVYLLLSVLLRRLSIVGARIAGLLGFGVYLGLLFGFGAGQAGQRCMHIAVVTVPSPYPFFSSPRLLEVHRFSLLPLLPFIRRSRSLSWYLLFSLFPLSHIARISFSR